MKKKFFTLLAAATVAASAGAQTIYYNAEGKVNFQVEDVDPAGELSAFFGHVPFGGAIDATAQIPVSKLTNINKGAESKLIQLIAEQDGVNYALAMQWDKATKKYQLVGVSTTDPQYNYFVDETLWEVRATYVGTSKDLRYVLINKAAQLPLQLNPAENEGIEEDADGNKIAAPSYIQGSVITWSWSNVADTKDEDEALSGVLKAAIDKNNSIYISGFAENEGLGIATVGMIESNAIPENAMEFAAYEATDVMLNASQINSLMTGTKDQAPVQFKMSPDVVGATAGNPLTSNKFKAIDGAVGTYGYDFRNYVRFEVDGKSENYLRVDTTYFNEDKNDSRYELKLTTNKIEVPRQLLIADDILGDGSTEVTKSNFINSLAAQSYFRVKYSPSAQSVLLQAYQYVYFDKKAEVPRWELLALKGNDVQSMISDLSAASIADSEVDNIAGLLTDPEATPVIKVKPTVTEDNPIKADEWTSGLIKLTTLTTQPEHTELTVGYDIKDADVNKGIRSIITLGKFKTAEAANIASGYYYIQNGNQTSDLIPSGYWRVQDLGATNATATAFDKTTGKWIIAKDADNSLNVVYSENKLNAIPAAQWFVQGDAGFYTITNRESASSYLPGTTYLWAVEGKENTFACKGLYANTEVNDTIVLAKVPAMDMKMGYMNISQDVAKADTTVFTFQYASLNEPYTVAADDKGLLQVMKDNATEFKVERVSVSTEDYYGEVTNTNDLVYGLSTSEADVLKRAQYRIYRENVSSGSSEVTGKRTREYIVLDGDKYKLQAVEVIVDADGYTTMADADAKDTRKCFYIKNVSNVANEFVLVDPAQASNTGLKGTRVFVNQQSGVLQPGDLKSDASTNSYANSIFSFTTVRKDNYRDIRRAGADRDTVTFFKNSNPEILLFEGNAKGANVGLLDRTNNKQTAKNYAMFIDTANVHNTAMPMFLIGLRSKDYKEVSNIEEHNHHLYTTADYLVSMADSVAANPVYKDYNGRVRLGFVPAKHEGQKLIINSDNKSIDLSANSLTPASFAFRYIDTTRDAFYIETATKGGDLRWVKVINEIPVLVSNIEDAEAYSLKATTDAPTSNDNAVVSEVSVIATTGAVIVKNAAGKTVVVSDVLGKSVATTVLTSDDATIAVPAGIVFVTVDGKTTKVVVK